MTLPPEPGPIAAVSPPLPVPRGLDLLARGLLGVATALLLLIVALVVAQVAARNLWNIGLPRAEEVSRLAGVLAVYLTAPVLAIHGHHVAVDVFSNLMPRLPRIACRILAELSVMAFALLSVWGGWMYLQRAWKFRTPALGLPNIVLFAPVVACFVLLAGVALWRIGAILRAERAAGVAARVAATGAASQTTKRDAG